MYVCAMLQSYWGKLLSLFKYFKNVIYLRGRETDRSPHLLAHIPMTGGTELEAPAGSPSPERSRLPPAVFPLGGNPGLGLVPTQSLQAV